MYCISPDLEALKLAKGRSVLWLWRSNILKNNENIFFDEKVFWPYTFCNFSFLSKMRIYFYLLSFSELLLYLLFVTSLNFADVGKKFGAKRKLDILLLALFSSGKTRRPADKKIGSLHVTRLLRYGRRTCQLK